MSTVRWLHSEMPGSPWRFTSDGFSAHAQIFDAFLINGFTSRTPTSISVASGVCTATFSTPGLFPLFSVVRVSGASVPQVNGDFVVDSVSGSSISFATPGAPDGNVGGSVAVALAPIGWSRPFSDSANRVYRPASFYAGDPYFYRLSPSSGVASGLSLVSGATSANSGSVLASGYLELSVPYASVAWLAIGNGSTFYLLINNGATTVDTYPLITGGVYAFGAAAPIDPADGFLSVISFFSGANVGQLINNGSNIAYCGPLTGGSNNFRAARTINGVSPGPNLAMTMESLYPGSPAASGNFTAGVAFPNAGNNALVLSRIAVYENYSLRGILPGVYVSPQNCASFYNMLQIVDGTGALAGRKLLAVRCGTTSTSNTGPGVIFFDITGPWSYTP